MTERIATEKTKAHIIRRHAEGATYHTIEKELKADPELTSLDHSTVHRYVVPEARKQDYATKKKYRSTEQGALADIWAKMNQSGHKVEMTFEQFVNAWE